jgi:hydroxymethylbilane synthase
VSERVRVGTRRSVLAKAQTDLVLGTWREHFPDTEFEAVPIVSAGDRTKLVIEGLDFTDALDEAVEAGMIDCAVHSAKDLPSGLIRSVSIVAFPRRADPRDCLVLGRPDRLATLPRGARIGSSSPRRRAQIERQRPDIQVVEIRGNVDSRIRMVRQGTVDGAILARAGLDRLGRGREADEILDAVRFVPAPGQGALAVVARKNDSRMARLARPLDHLATRQAVVAERAVAESLGGDCHLPLGVLARVRGGTVSLLAEILSADGRRTVVHRGSGEANTSRALGQRVARDLVKAGALALAGVPEPRSREGERRGAD